jgi:hypothetical protein
MKMVVHHGMCVLEFKENKKLCGQCFLYSKRSFHYKMAMSSGVIGHVIYVFIYQSMHRSIDSIYRIIMVMIFM